MKIIELEFLRIVPSIQLGHRKARYYAGRLSYIYKNSTKILIWQLPRVI